jgi:transcriptional regulator with XRE-family HTH domain
VSDDADVMAAWINAVIAQNVGDFRRNLGLSQNALAKEAGIAASMVAFVEGGSRQLIGRTLPRLVAALGVAPHTLLMQHPHVPCPFCRDRPGEGLTCNYCRCRGPELDSIAGRFTR